MNLVPLRYLSKIPITNGLGLSGAHDNPEWPRYIRTTDIAGPASLRDDVFASQPPDVAAAAMVARGDILMTAAGSIGKSVTFSESYPACYAGFLVRVRPYSETEGRFLGYWAQSTHYWDQIRSGAVKSTIENFSAGRYRALLAPQPELSQQRAIVDYLDEQTKKIDALLGEQEGLIEVLMERRSAVVFRAVTKGLDSSVPLISSGVDWLGAVPTHWTVTSLRRVGRFVTGTTPPGASEESFDGEGAVGWARPEDLQRRVIPTRRLSRAGESEIRIVRDAVLICGIGATVGKVGFAEGRCSSNQQLTALITAQSGLFWYYALLAARAELVSLSTGNTLPILNNERLAQLRVAIPPIEEQRHTAEYLDEETKKIDALIAEAEGIVAVAKERKAALITAAVTGQIDVRRKVA